jgi:hypothetical protein
MIQEKYTKDDIKNRIRPRILLLGNGINRAFNEDSWSNLLDDIKIEKYHCKSSDYEMPMPLKATLLTNNNANKSIVKKLDQKKVYGPYNQDLVNFLRRYTKLEFTDILTTNYGYEIEASLLEDGQINNNRLEKIEGPKKFKKKERNVKSFFKFDTTKVWHIHGEYRKVQSLVLDHKSYCDMLSQYKDRADSFKDRLNRKLKKFDLNGWLEITSWIDAFLLGDVYIVGFGMDFSEIDLWWLIGEKYSYRNNFDEKNRDILGKTTYFNLQLDNDENIRAKKDFNCKLELMRVYGVEVKNISIKKLLTAKEDNRIYTEFHSEVSTILKNEII